MKNKRLIPLESTLNVDTLAEPKLVFGKGTLNVGHVGGQGTLACAIYRVRVC
jgi:hypothetical protein